MRFGIVMSNHKTLGEKIASLRKSAGYTQDELAKKIGLSHPAVNKWENDVNRPSMKNIYALSEILNVTIDQLLSKESKNPKNTAMEPTPSYDKESSRIIPLINTSLQGEEHYEPITLPVPRMQQQQLIAMLVEADNVAPALLVGDIIIASRVDDMQQLRAHTIYIVEVGGDRLVRYVRCLSDHIVLHDHINPGIAVPYSEVSKAWEFRLRITNKLTGEESNLQQRIAQIESYLENNNPDWRKL